MIHTLTKQLHRLDSKISSRRGTLVKGLGRIEEEDLDDNSPRF